MEENNKNQIGIEIKPDVASGIYSNLAVITHSKSEFILDFAAMLPGLQKAVVGSRVVMAPEHAKRLLLALQDNVAKYENQFGPIDLGNGPKGGATFPFPGSNFGGGAKS